MTTAAPTAALHKGRLLPSATTALGGDLLNVLGRRLGRVGCGGTGMMVEAAEGQVRLLEWSGRRGSDGRASGIQWRRGAGGRGKAVKRQRHTAPAMGARSGAGRWRAHADGGRRQDGGAPRWEEAGSVGLGLAIAARGRWGQPADGASRWALMRHGGGRRKAAASLGRWRRSRMVDWGGLVNARVRWLKGYFGHYGKKITVQTAYN